ncbi:hypothetical protein LZ198_01150 [Myxococcus sp. K15C18031901]|uniref:NADase-type glycan-binding domain-containing protein n=1 Tax=Myxococcus dinghuensis TaxID=2906761 RepID=UPI0020A7413C|nr:hypothetical protein [Myxococcus dinghuensis]MCP3097474.1 hypothetical protein [Myxococcus dinghuensis]
MILLSLILAAAPPVLLEPNVDGAHRLHPRRVTASSFLENGWNKHAQNYLPLYIADDDPATAWVEGAKGRGEGEALEWWGPELQQAEVFRVFLRNGYQKSAKLYQANARPQKVKLEPLVQGETGPQTTGTAVEVELKDVLGWQEVRVPVPTKVQGVRLTIVSTFPGTTYDDTCLSDLRVYVVGKDPYKAEAENAAFEQVRAFAFERKQAATRTGAKAAIEWAPRFKQETLFTRENSDEQAVVFVEHGASTRKWLDQFPAGKAYQAELERAKAAAALYDRVNLDQDGTASEARAKWTRVKPAERAAQKAAATTALSAMEDPGLVRVAGLLHLADASFFESDAAQSKLQKKLTAARKVEAREQATCVKKCEADRKGRALEEFEKECSCVDYCNGCDEPGGLSLKSEEFAHQLTGGEFVQGSLAKPTAFLRGVTEDAGSRASWLVFRQTLVTYDGEKASTVLIAGAMESEAGDPVFVHVLGWSDSGGKAKVTSITTFVMGIDAIRVIRYVPATSA